MMTIIFHISLAFFIVMMYYMSWGVAAKLYMGFVPQVSRSNRQKV